MENLDIIILSAVATIGFIVFIVGCFKELSKMEKEDYIYNSKQKKFGRDALYYMIENLFDDTKGNKDDKVKLIKIIDRTISDMEYDGIYFSDEVKEKLKEEKKELLCEYSGLPSSKAYETNFY